MMTHGGILACAVAGAFTVAAPAFAQETKHFDVELSARALYDSNVSRSNATVAALRGLEQEDVIFSPTVTVDILQPFGRQSAFLTGTVGYDFYDQNDQLNRERIALQGGVNGAFGPCRATVAGGYARRQSELEDLQLTTVENVETLTSVSLSNVCGRSVGLGVTAALSQEWADNSAALRRTSDYESASAMVGLVYQRPTFGELTLFSRYGRTEYEDRLVPAGAGFEKDGFESYGGGVTYARRIGARLRGSLSAGYSSVQPMAAGTPEFEGFTYAADLTFQPSSRIQARLAFERAVKPSNRLLTTYAVDNTYSLDAEYAIGTRIKLGLGGSYTDSAYEGAALGNGLFVTDEQIRSIYGSVRFAVSERLALKLDALQQERDANVHGVDYTSNRVGVSVVASF